MTNVRRLLLVPVPLMMMAALRAQPPPPRHLTTESIAVLTPAILLAKHGLAGTDLGVSFPCGDRLVFLFGDSWTRDGKDRDVDSAAWCALAPLPKARLPELRWFARDDGRFAPLGVPGLGLHGMEVPVEGAVIGGRTFVLFSSGWDRKRGMHSHSVCAATTGHDFARLELVWRVATGRFVNVSVVADGDTAWIFGTGPYRKSSVFLARVAVADFANRSAWRYWPGFVPDESAAKPLVVSDCLGELSVRRLPAGDWAMLANGAQPRGIQLRTATAPTGPWSDPVVVFDPARDRGYGFTMHQKNGAVGYDDGLAEPGREQEWGGEYGPYLVPTWCRSPAKGVQELVYALSTWNPYTVRLVRSVVAEPGVSWSPPPGTREAPAAGGPPRNLDFARGELTGWRAEGDAFTSFARPDGTWVLCTYVAPRGDAVVGKLGQEFVVPATAKELRGIVSGGNEAVQLWRGDELLRSTRGVRSNDVDVPFRWRLEDLHGQRVRLVIADDATGPWGFVSVRALQLVE